MIAARTWRNKVDAQPCPSTLVMVGIFDAGVASCAAGLAGLAAECESGQALMPYRWPDLSVDDGKVNGSARRLVLATAFVIGALVTPPHADAAFPGK
ncbi:MAG TPA: hypothetical protein VGQ26_03880 [Streptosporangiaceae bacterium]|nr:hypothetical protein [Streptosporangiaceae bacterium]